MLLLIDGKTNNFWKLIKSLKKIKLYFKNIEITLHFCFNFWSFIWSVLIIIIFLFISEAI